jgi:tetratricopeptide (TPR) repeat protein
MNIGIAYFAENEINMAIRYLKRSIEEAPYISESHYWLGMSYLKSGFKKEAAKELGTAVEVGKDSEFGLKAERALRSISGNK